MARRKWLVGKKLALSKSAWDWIDQLARAYELKDYEVIEEVLACAMDRRKNLPKRLKKAKNKPSR